MNLYEKIRNREENIALIGLGYVGMPIAISFSKKVNVLGFDINKEKISLYKRGIDITKEVGDDVIKNSNVDFTCNENRLRECRFHIVAVPTPINGNKTPDLRPLTDASKILGKNLMKDSIVVYESTVYPGVTEEICIPILEEESGLKCGEDFKVGYSPERINPGDKLHRLENITKVVSGMDEDTLNIIAKVYGLIIDAGVYKAESIKVAEAAKVIENSQRDINIAFINELSMIFNKMEIDTKSVLKAAATKWNFLKFSPGLVGGHCIGVDPYYLTHKAEQLGYHSQVILSGRRINDGMGKYIAESTVKNLIKANKQVKGAKVAIFGITFKEDCPDVRNSKVIDIIDELKEYGLQVIVTDPIANFEEVKKEYGVELTNIDELNNIDAIIFAVGHKEYLDLSLEDIKEFYSSNLLCTNDGHAVDEIAITVEEDELVLVDVKGIFNKSEAELNNYLYWRL